jgi:hypothetical protein
VVFCPVVAVVMLESQVARCVCTVRRKFLERDLWTVRRKLLEQGVCTVRRKLLEQLPPHSAHILPPDSPAPQQLQQDRKP